MNKSISYIILLIAFPFYFTGCKKEVRPTSMTIKDSIRHYYPIKQGQQLELMFTNQHRRRSINHFRDTTFLRMHHTRQKFAHHYTGRRHPTIQSHLQQY